MNQIPSSNVFRGLRAGAPLVAALVAALGGSISSASPLALQQFDWKPTFAGTGIQAPSGGPLITSITAVPGPHGADLAYLGGNLGAINGCPVGPIASWDRVAFRALGSGLEGGVSSAVEFQGDLYVSGGSLTVDGQPANGIARWDGVSWSTLPGGGLQAPGIVLDLEVHDDGSGEALFVIGWFSQAGGVPANNVAKWTGSAWAPLGAGFDSIVESATVWDDGGGAKLYVTGFYDYSGGVPMPGVARWNGAQWQSVGSGGPSNAYTIGSFDGPGGGVFVPKGGWIWRFDGVSWSQTAAGNAYDFETFDDGVSTRYFAAGDADLLEWDGSTWTSVGSFFGAASPGGCRSLGVADFGANGGRQLLVGGAFASLQAPSLSGPLLSHGLALFDGADWSVPEFSLSSGTDNNVNAFAKFDDGRGEALYVGGAFQNAGGVAASRVARWDGQSWEALGAGVSANVNAMAVYDDGSGDALYVGGAFMNAGGASAKRIARWDGSQWSALGAGLTGAVQSMVVFDDGSGAKLVVGGQFTSAGGIPAQRVATWDGANWAPLGFGLNDVVEALAVFDDGSGPALYAGGEFFMSGIASVRGLARWSGSAWVEVGGGLDGRALTLLADGDELYVGGEFFTFDPNPIQNLARWSSAAWSAVTVPAPSDIVQALALFDEGQGSHLYVGGRFLSPAVRVGRVEGAQLVQLGASTTGHVSSLAVFDDGRAPLPALYVGGPFDGAGSFSSPHIARWANGVVAPPTSYCTAGTTSNGCQALIGSSGEPSRCANDGFEIAVSGVEGQKLGIVFFGSAPSSSQWGTGTSFVCVAPPTRRASTQFSGGTAGACDGAFLLDFNAWMVANPASAPAPGDEVFVQAWFRDPASPKGTSLSNALRLEMAP